MWNWTLSFGRNSWIGKDCVLSWLYCLSRPEPGLHQAIWSGHSFHLIFYKNREMLQCGLVVAKWLEAPSAISTVSQRGEQDSHLMRAIHTRALLLLLVPTCGDAADLCITSRWWWGAREAPNYCRGAVEEKGSESNGKEKTNYPCFPYCYITAFQCLESL